jgi:hypothetical protein
MKDDNKHLLKNDGIEFPAVTVCHNQAQIKGGGSGVS